MSDDLISENCLNGMTKDTIEYLSDYDIDLVLVDGEIIGYAYASVSDASKNVGFIKKGEKTYYIEEIYIKPCFRNKGYGKKIFKHMEKKAIELGCKSIQLNAVSKKYKELLHFYIDELDMQFWNAYLIKKI